MTVCDSELAIVRRVNTFWSIVSFVVISGIGGFVAFVFYYWFVVIPKQVFGR
jgi:hypothetical protein